MLHEIRIQTGVVAKELRDQKSVPAETAHIWQWFSELSSTRTSGMSINPIGWTEMKAFFDLFGIEPEMWEIRALRMLDDEYLMNRMSESGDKAIGSAREMSALLR
jgi:hypothetical protein